MKQESVDAWGGSTIEYEKFFRDDGFSETVFPLIAKGPLLPSDVFIGSSQLGSEAVTEMRSRISMSLGPSMSPGPSMSREGRASRTTRETSLSNQQKLIKPWW